MSQGAHIDDNLRAVDRALRELAQLEVDHAARERTWLVLSHQLERVSRHFEPSFHGRLFRDAHFSKQRLNLGGYRRVLAPRGFAGRLAFGTLAAMVVVIALALGVYGGTVWMGADNGKGPHPAASVTSSESQLAAGATSAQTSVSADQTFASATSAVATSTSAAEEPSVATNTATTSGATTTISPGGSGSTAPSSTAPPATKSSPTQPESTEPQPSTTQEQFASAQRDNTAKAVALDLGSSIMEYFASGDMSGAQALVAPAAQPSLIQMIRSLKNPAGYAWTGMTAITADTVRVVLEFSDAEPNTVGEATYVTKRYALTVKVTDDTAVITAITAAP